MTAARTLIQAAYREGNLLSVGTVPTAAEFSEALAAFNRYVRGIFGNEMGEELVDWLVPAPQRTAPVAANFPQLPFPTDTAGDIWPLPYATDPSNAIYPYPPKNSRIVFGSVTNPVYFPDTPQDGSRMALIQGSGAGDGGMPGTASGVLTQTAVPTAGKVVTVGGVTYTWVAAFVAPLTPQVLIGFTVSASLANLVQAINGGEGVGLVYSVGTVANELASATSNSATGTLTATALQDGAGGNSIVSTTNDTNGAWGASTLAGGQLGALLTLDGNGRTIGGAPQQQYYAPVPNMQWLYRADLGDWVPVQDMGLNDQCPFPEEFDDFFICALSMRLAPRYEKITTTETRNCAVDTLKRLKARYRQAGVTVYGSSDMPRSLQSYISGRWWY